MVPVANGPAASNYGGERERPAQGTGLRLQERFEHFFGEEIRVFVSDFVEHS